MNDLISRNEAAKRLEDLAKQKEDTFAGDVLEFAAKVVRGVPAAEVPHWATEQAYKNGYEDGYADGKIDFAPKWIPVAERMPDPYVHVIASRRDANGERRCGQEYVTLGNKWICDNFIVNIARGSEVTHWMPLPEPPKGE